MSYTPINWQTGDTITAEKMNKMDNGWSVTSGVATLCNETVTTYLDGEDNAADLTISGGSIEAESITVTYDSVVYTCADDGGMYGAPYDDYSDYPFTIYPNGWMLCETSGTHTVKIEATVTTVESSQSFADAVASVAPVFQIIIDKTTWQQAYDAMASGKIAYYGFEVDDTVEQYIATQAIYNMDTEQYEIYAVYAGSSGAVTSDTIFAFSSDGVLRRN